MSNATKVLSKQILLLVTNPNQHGEFERFLTNRGWQLRLHVTLNGFLADVMQTKPGYAVMSVDHTDPSTAFVKRLLTTSYEVPVIEVSENGKIAAWSSSAAAAEFPRIVGPLTGPAFERVAALIERAENSRTERGQMRLLRDRVSHVFRKVIGDAGDTTVSRPLSAATHTLCIQIASPKLNGHFLLAAGDAALLELDLVKTLTSALRSLVVAVGGDVEVFQSFPLEVRDVDFMRWASAESDFLERAVKNGVEVALAFFPEAAENFALASADDLEHLSIKLDDLVPDRKVDYDLFLQLPLNGKYLLYVPRGGVLSLKQKLGLREKGVTRLQVDRLERLNVLRERARSRLGQLVSKFARSPAA